jgi:hypothetical protein
MSSLTMPSAVAPTLPALNIHPNGHGHKKGSPLDPTADSSSSTAAPIQVGSAPSLFGSLFSSLQQILGAQPAPAATNPAVSAGNTASTSAAAGSAAAVAPKISVMA